jgi:hypothetical protein
MERQELLALLGHLESVGCLECQEYLDQRATVVSLVLMVLREKWEDLV